MSLADLFAGEKCGLDIYEEPSEDVYVECQTAIAFYSCCAATAVVVVITIIIIAINGTGAFTLAIPALIIAAAVTGYLLAGRIARLNHRRTQREISSYMANGKSRAEAIDTIREERLRRETNAALRASRR